MGANGRVLLPEAESGRTRPRSTFRRRTASRPKRGDQSASAAGGEGGGGEQAASVGDGRAGRRRRLSSSRSRKFDRRRAAAAAAGGRPVSFVVLRLACGARLGARRRRRRRNAAFDARALLQAAPPATSLAKSSWPATAVGVRRCRRASSRRCCARLHASFIRRPTACARVVPLRGSPRREWSKSPWAAKSTGRTTRLSSRRVARYRRHRLTGARRPAQGDSR